MGSVEEEETGDEWGVGEDALTRVIGIKARRRRCGLGWCRTEHDGEDSQYEVNDGATHCGQDGGVGLWSVLRLRLSVNEGNGDQREGCMDGG
jgi:hypothetical protein